MATLDTGPDQRTMTMRERVFIGGVGAFVPAILTFSVDGYVEFLHSDYQYILGFAARLMGLFAVGGFWVYIHRTENNPLNVFQLGIVAPAMLMGVINANLGGGEPLGQSPSQSGRQVSGWSFVSPALAQPARPAPRVAANPAVKAGNISRYVGKGRWDWTVFVKASPEVLKRIRCVEYTLHPTFRPPVRRVCGTEDPRHPFGLSTNGWGAFKIGIKVEFTDGRPLDLDHMLTFSKPKASDSFLRGVFGLK